MLDHMKALTVLAVIALALTGCTATPEPEPDYTSTFDDGGPNGVACRAFSSEWPAAFEASGQSNESQWNERSDRIDAIALKAEGDVKERMLAFVEDWPDLFDLMMGNLDDINKRLGDVERACDAAGENIDGMQLVESD